MFKAGQAVAGKPDHGLFSIHAKKEKFWPVSQRQKPRADKLNGAARSTLAGNVKPFVDRFVRQLELSNPEQQV